MRIAIVENIDFLPGTCMAEIRKYGELRVCDTKPASEEELITAVGDAEVLIIKRTKLPETIFKRLPQLKFVITLSYGTGHIDIAKATELGIQVLHCPIYNNHAVVEHTFALLFAACRNIVESNIRLRNGDWKLFPEEFIGYEIANKNLVVIGNGRIGHEVGELAKRFGMIVSTIDSKTSKKTFKALLLTADFISIHIPLTNKTRDLIDSEVLHLLKKPVIIINTAKAEIINQKALLEVLTQKLIGGFACDIIENDLVSGKLSPEMRKMITLSNVTATPHIAFNTKEANIRLGKELLAHLQKIAPLIK